jgi:hypothetical protein
MIVATMYIGIVFDWLADLTHLANYYKLESREGALIDIKSVPDSQLRWTVHP